jgi:inhibitor of KinA sporulation pathway (predicted exonuclease)
MVREFGMTGEPYKSNIHVYGGNSMQFTFTESLEQDAKKIIEKAFEDVMKQLKKHKDLLLTISKFLASNSRLDKPELKAMCVTYFKAAAITDIELVDIDGYYNFRKHLLSL